MINSKEDFERESHYRIADRCCGNCKHGLGDFEGEATCEHPKRNDFGRHLYKIMEIDWKVKS